MDDRVILSPQARGDLERARIWYTQLGAGQRAKGRLLHVLRAIADLADAPHHWPTDPDHPGARMRIVEGHRVRFAVRSDGRNFVLRIYGPWQQRANA